MKIARSDISAHRKRAPALVAVAAMIATLILVGPATAAPRTAGTSTVKVVATNCSAGQSGAAVATVSSGRAAVRTTIGVAKSMGISVKGQIVAVMVMYQESSIRNLANDGSSTQTASWPSPGRAYWMNVTRLSLKYPHDKFGSLDGAHDTDSVGLYQQRPAYGWGNYGSSSGTTDPEGAVQRLLDPRWEAMAFFGGPQSAAPTSGLLDIAGWAGMAPTNAANAVQRSSFPDFYARWEAPATSYVNANQDAPAITLPWYPGGGGGALSCTSIPSNPAAGEAGRNPLGALDAASIDRTGIRLSGWMLDPDAANGIGQIHFYDQGPFGTTGYPTGLANQPRDDVNRAFNVLGQYGFVSVLPWTGAGKHTICAYGINVGRGTGNPQLGCRDVIVPGPVGWVDVVRAASGQIEVMGWAADPASPAAREEVHIYVTGPQGTSGTPGTFTGDARPDVGAALGWAGDAQGFHATVTGMGTGANQVCGYAINVKPPSTNPQIGCRTVLLRANPIGYLDAVSVVGGNAQVAGWTLDPNSPAVSIPVHIYVSSAAGLVNAAAYTADDPRPDVNSVIGVTGNHGYSRTIRLYPGSNSVCAFGITTNTDTGNQLLGCRTVQSAPAPALLAVPDSGQVDGITQAPPVGPRTSSTPSQSTSGPPTPTRGAAAASATAQTPTAAELTAANIAPSTGSARPTTSTTTTTTTTGTGTPTGSGS